MEASSGTTSFTEVNYPLPVLPWFNACRCSLLSSLIITSFQRLREISQPISRSHSSANQLLVEAFKTKLFKQPQSLHWNHLQDPLFHSISTLLRFKEFWKLRTSTEDWKKKECPCFIFGMKFVLLILCEILKKLIIFFNIHTCTVTDPNLQNGFTLK